MTKQQIHLHKPAPSPEGAYADELSISAYRKVIAGMQQQRTVLQLNSMIGQDPSRKTAMQKIDEHITSLENTLKSVCKHNYVEDYIDINPDRGTSITYCDKCFLTFPTR
jgi:hypothetical protein